MKEPLALVQDFAQPPMHDARCRSDSPAEEISDALVPQTNTQNGQVGLQDGLPADPEIPLDFGPSGAWGEHDVVDLEATHFAPGDLVVAHHDGWLAIDLGEVLKEIEGKGVVVVDQQCFHGRLPALIPWKNQPAMRYFQLSRVLRCGKGSSGIGTLSALQSGSQPSRACQVSKRRAGTVSLTVWLYLSKA